MSTTEPADDPGPALRVAATIAYDESFRLDVEFEVEAGASLGLSGDIGAGKSSVLNLLAGRLQATDGLIIGPTGVWDDRQKGVFTTDRPVAFARQSFRDQLAEDRTGVENAIDASTALGPRRPDLEHADLEVMARSILAGLGVEEHVVDRLPWTFSGAEAQRVALATALTAASSIAGPSLTLIDEPTGALDRSTKANVIAFLQSWLEGYDGVAVIASGDADLLAAITVDTVVLQPR